MTARAARDYLGKRVEKAGIAKPITPRKLRHTYVPGSWRITRS
jgi:hypothetical protein